MKEEWLFPNAIVPVDVETTAALVAEIHRLIGVVGGMALAQPEQERFLVATIGNWGRVEWADGVFPSVGDKMYSAPRRMAEEDDDIQDYKKPWVGLNKEEANKLQLKYQGKPISLSAAVGNLLREKNT